MKYIRTKDGIFTISRIYAGHIGYMNANKTGVHWTEQKIALKDETPGYKTADTIEELCDEFVVVQKDFHDLLNADTHCLQTLKKYYEINKIEVLGIYGAIWTDKGLIYVAKMNDKGELELL